MKTVKIVPEKLCRADALAAVVAGFRRLAEAPANPEYGICFNLGEVVHVVDSYVLVDALFACALEVPPRQVSTYPIKRQRGGMWATKARRRWCKVFADSLETGTMCIPDDLYRTLKAPLPVSF